MERLWRLKETRHKEQQASLTADGAIDAGDDGEGKSGSGSPGLLGGPEFERYIQFVEAVDDIVREAKEVIRPLVTEGRRNKAPASACYGPMKARGPLSGLQALVSFASLLSSLSGCTGEIATPGPPLPGCRRVRPVTHHRALRDPGQPAARARAASACIPRASPSRRPASGS